MRRGRRRGASICLKPSAISASTASLTFLVIGATAPVRARRLPSRRGGTDFVAQFNNDALGGLFADTGNLRERLHIAPATAPRNAVTLMPLKMSARFRSDAADAVDEQTEQMRSAALESRKECARLADRPVA